MNEFFSAIIRNDFPFMILLGDFLLTLHYPKRKRWWIALFFVFVPFLLCNLIDNDGIAIGCIKYFVLFLSSFLPLFFYCKADLWTYIYVGTISYSVQHIIQRTTTLCLLQVTDNRNMWTFILQVFLSAVFYTIMYFLFVYRTEKNKLPVFDNKIQLFIALIVLSVTVVLSLFSIVMAMQLEDKTLAYITIIFSLICCISSLALELSQTKLKETQVDNRMLHIMLHESKKQYEASRKSIEQINIKCHDLKHLLNNINSKISRTEAIQLEKQIETYDHSFDSGNKALDVVLTEKAMDCHENSIRFTALINGSSLSFMSDTDIYSLFENALSNAIKSTLSLDEPHRVISITQEETVSVVSVIIKNYYSGIVVFNDKNIPIHQGQSIYHGYGTKSMIYIAEKYHGKVNFRTEDDIFIVTFSFQVNSDL